MSVGSRSLWTCRRYRPWSGRTWVVKKSGSSQSTLTFSGQTPVSFGFKAFHINFVNGKWALEGAEADGGLAFHAAGGGAPAAIDAEPVLLRRGGLVTIK